MGIENEEILEELTDVSLGIDVGIKKLAVCSDGNVYKNINKIKKERSMSKLKIL